MSAILLRRCAAVLTLCLGTSPIQGDLIHGEASAQGIESNLDVLAGTLTLQISPTPSVSGTAPAPFNLSDSLPTVSSSAAINIPLLGSVPIMYVTSDVNAVTAASDVDGGSGSRTTTASATVNNAQFGVQTVSNVLTVSSLISLEATLIQSTAMVTGSPGAIIATGDTVLAGTHGASSNQAALTVLGVEILLDAAPAPNTHLVINGAMVPGLTGTIDLFLNEQVTSGDLLNDASMTVNALRLSFDNVGVSLGSLPGGLLNGDLIIAQSFATMATPEPSSLGLCGVFLAVAGIRRRRRAAFLGQKNTVDSAGATIDSRQS